MPSKKQRFVERFDVVLMEDARVEMKPDGTCCVHGVKINANHSLNKVFYSDEVLRDATPLYEGAKVFDDHDEAGDPWGMTARRRRSILGRIKNVEFRPGGHRAEFHVLPSAVKSALADDIKADPHAFGFSHVVHADVDEKDDDEGYRHVIKIYEVESVDLVAFPATTKGIFENVNPRNRSEETLMSEPKGHEDRVLDVLQEQIKEKDAKVVTLVGERDAAIAESVGLKATVADLRGRLVAAETRADSAEKDVRGAKIERALAGLPESVAKALKEGTEPLSLEQALKVIEHTRAAAQATPAGKEPRSESRPAQLPTSGEVISDDAFLRAMSAY